MARWCNGLCGFHECGLGSTSDCGLACVWIQTCVWGEGVGRASNCVRYMAFSNVGALFTAPGLAALAVNSECTVNPAGMFTLAGGCLPRRAVAGSMFTSPGLGPLVSGGRSPLRPQESTKPGSTKLGRHRPSHPVRPARARISGRAPD